MLKSIALLGALAVATPVLADEWVRLRGSDIVEALKDKTLDYGNATQTFFHDGRSVYGAGRESWGEWRAQGDRYCSVWPPNPKWACYDLEISTDGQSVRFWRMTGCQRSENTKN